MANEDPAFAKGTCIAFMPPLTEGQLDCLWAELSRNESKPSRTGGLIWKVVSRLWGYKPNNLEKGEFLNTVLNETAIRFKKYFNSSFKPPMERWLYMQAWSATLDFVKVWEPGFRSDPEDQPKGFVDFDDVRDRIESQSPQSEPCKEWNDLVLRGALFDETLTDVERRSAAEHCSECAACCRLLATSVYILQQDNREYRRLSAAEVARAAARGEAIAHAFWARPADLRRSLRQLMLHLFEMTATENPREFARKVFLSTPEQDGHTHLGERDGPSWARSRKRLRALIKASRIAH